MSELVLTDAGRVAMLQGWVARAAGSRIHMLSASTSVLAVITLGNPCGVIVDGKLSLVQADEEGDLIASTGVPVSAQWITTDDTVLATGSVTDEAGEGPFRLADGTQLFAGGRALLGTTVLE